MTSHISSLRNQSKMLFYVTVKATADGEMDNPPSTLVFELHRRKDGATSTLTGNLVAGSNPVKYEAQWNVTQQKGRWEIKTQGYISNTVQFKIDKREQIDHLANSYVGAPNTAGAGHCEHFVGVVYGHLGLALSNTSSPNGLADAAPLTDPKGYVTRKALAIEDLTGIRDRTSFHREMRWQMGNWSFLPVVRLFDLQGQERRREPERC